MHRPNAEWRTAWLLASLLLGCHFAPYQAEGKLCDVTHACPDGLACVESVCAPCTSAVDCAPSETCHEGRCAVCSAGAACPTGEQCVSGACEADCTQTLQSLLDAAPAGSTVVVPACTYRETVTLLRPVTLRGRPQAMLKGSDVWEAWRAGDGGLYFQGPVPSLAALGPCRSGTTRCAGAEQVFRDGVSLEQVPGVPGPQQFSLDPAGNVLIASDPRGHLLEVTTRTRWVVTASDGVHLRELSFAHAAASAAQGALSNQGFSHWSLTHSSLADVAASAVTLQGGADLLVADDEVARAGEVAINVLQVDGGSILRNHLHDGNGEGFDPDGRAGGLVAAGVQGLVVQDNVIHANAGVGVEIRQSTNVDVEHNTVDHDTRRGIILRQVRGGTVASNRLWENAWEDTTWGWGAGIVLWVSAGVEVHDNVLAWNGDGLSVISQTSGDPTLTVHDVFVHDNLIVNEDDPSDATLWHVDLGWLQDYAGPLYDADAGNRGAGNRFWNTTAEAAAVRRFGWGDNTGVPFLSTFAATPGGAGSSYVLAQTRDDLLGDAGVPLSPEAR